MKEKEPAHSLPPGTYTDKDGTVTVVIENGTIIEGARP